MDLPKRHRNHEIEELSERFFKACIPINWVVNPFKKDYGTDFNCEITINNGVTGINFSVQLKGKETDSGKEYITIGKLKRTTINRWLKRLEPTMIIVHIIDDDEAYWTWFEESSFDLTKKNNTYQLKISRNNKLSTINWQSVIEYLEKIFSRKNLLYDLPKLDENKDAWSLFLNKQFELALPKFKIITESKKDGLIWNAISVCQYELYHYQDALISINKAIELHKDNFLLSNKAATLTELGIQRKDKSILNQAIKIYKELLLSGENNAELHYNFANALNGLDNFDEAIEQFIETLRINPNHARAWKNLGSIYYQFGNHHEELRCYDNALKIEPHLPEAIFSKGVTLFHIFGEINEGLKLMIKSTEITDRFEYEFPIAYFWIAEAFFELREFESSLAWNEKGLINNPSNVFLLKQNEKIKNAC